MYMQLFSKSAAHARIQAFQGHRVPDGVFEGGMTGIIHRVTENQPTKRRATTDDATLEG
jgi:hypothetical protein